jgi:Druantia protein DruA
VSSSNIIPLRSREAKLKRKLRAHLKQIGFHKGPDGTLLPPALDKATYRSIHAHRRTEKLVDQRDWIAAKSGKLIRYFASGTEVDVRGIRPRIEQAPGDTWQSDLFRFASFYWRIPISVGYGRRLRFLVWDDNNGKLIGLLALGDAVFNLRARDELIGWDHTRRAEALVNLMDAYVLGAVPPYNTLLGGKLIASLARTSDIVHAFDAKYRDTVGVISKKQKAARLVAITTSSALGRSSIYNRLKLGGRLLFEPIGYTSGWGHFHISDALFGELRDYLKHVGDRYANAFKFGQGPNWRLRLIRRTLDLLGMNPDLIRHGFAREVFFCPIATNAIAFLRGDHKRVHYKDLPNVRTASNLALERWVIPRAERMPEYVTWRSERFLQELTEQVNGPTLQPKRGRWTGRSTG